jgi:hypothetical protein
MKGLCPVCYQPAEVIEGCAYTLNIHYLMQEGGAKLCPGSGEPFYEYLNATSQQEYSGVGMTFTMAGSHRRDKSKTNGAMSGYCIRRVMPSGNLNLPSLLRAPDPE